MKTVTKAKVFLVNGAIAFALIGAISTPASAATAPSQGSNLLSQVMNQLNSLRDYFNKTVADKLQPLSESLGKDINAVVNDVTGALGLPDPIKSREEVEKAAASSDGLVYSAATATNEVDRQITRGTIDSTLGQEGQQQIKEQAEATQNSVGSVQQQAQAAQSEVVTQNVMKQIALQNAQTGAILGDLRADALQSAQRQELTNLNLTNISRAIDGQNQANQSEQVGAGFETFRTATRARLF